MTCKRNPVQETIRGTKELEGIDNYVEVEYRAEMLE